MTLHHVGYINATDRVAAACIAAVKPWFAKFESDLIALESRADPTSRTSDLVVRLARQAAHQGLAPADLDTPNGTAALAAIADAIFSGKKKPAFYATLPPEWKHVVGAAQRIVDRERQGKRR
jgi:hypothetical protein